MKRSESQSLYKALPGQYVSYYLSKPEKARLKIEKAVIKISYWNKVDIDPNEIYKPKIVNQVCSNLLDFLNASQKAQGSSIEIDGAIRTLANGHKDRVRFVQAKINDSDFIQQNSTDQIFGHINPKMFYCQTCGKIKIIEKDSDVKSMYCHNHAMEQYTRIWICGCGESLPIDNFDIREGDRYFASEPNGVTSADGNKRLIPNRKCPNCGQFMTMVNTNDNKVFYPRTITTIKLYNNNYAKLCEYDEGCNLILKKHKHEISKEDFIRESETILNNKPNESPEQSLSELNGQDFINALLNSINIVKPENPKQFADKEIVYKVLEYDTLEEKKVTNMQKAIEKAIKFNNLSDSNSVLEMAEKMHMKDIYSVSDIEVIDTAYGYTRKYQSPDNKPDNSEKLALRAFTEKSNPGVPIFYNIRTKTEGIVIDIDIKEMFKYVKESLSKSFNIALLKEESEIKDWFLDKNNIDPDLIKVYNDIEEDSTFKSAATKIVYTILHTISHAAIQSISKYSGIDKDSLTEMIFPNLCSILIYANTNQAIVLGAITSMFDRQIHELLESILKDAKTCSFDPVCINDTGSCVACSYLKEAACEHFNKDLNRRYLYGYHKNYKDIKGFWEELNNGDNASK